MPSLRRWRASQLFGAWVVYWLLLVAVTLGRPLLVARRISQLPEGRSKASASFGDGAFDVRMVVDNVTVWHGHAPYGIVLAWLVIPPLLLWLAWVAVRPRPEDADVAPPRELRGGEASLDRAAGRRDRVREDR
jgi:hypothetical protein